MARIPPDERSVYLAFKNVFKGPDARMRAAKKIKKKVQSSKEENEEIRALVQEHDIDHIGNTVKALLEAEIFESTMKAKIHFPEVFDVSPAQSAERAVSEAEAAKTEADAIRDVTVGQQDDCISTTFDGETAMTNKEGKQPGKSEQGLDFSKLTCKAQQTSLLCRKPHPELMKAHSLYPLYLPAKGQRRLLNKVQDLLEHTCYTFGQRTMASELRKQAWDSSECVELNVWMGLFRAKETLFDAERLAAIGKPFPDLLSSIAQVRHTAVHRLRVTAGRVETLLADAETFSALLADDACARQLSRLRRETHFVIEEFGRNKDLLESRYTEKRKELAARRAELDCIEHAAWESMLEEDKQYQRFAGMNLEEVIDIPETTLHSAATSEVDETSEEGGSTESEREPEFCRVGESSRSLLSVPSSGQSGPSL